MPKPTRGAGPGQLRSHSRSSSSSKLGANLQFTQKDPQALKNSDKLKKPGYAHEAHPTKVAPGFARVNSSQRVHSREQLAHPSKRPAYSQQQLQQHHPHPHPYPQQQQQQPTKHVNDKNFAVVDATEEADDDDEWESSNSGVGTPNHQESDSDTASESEPIEQAILNLQLHLQPNPPRTQASRPPPQLQQYHQPQIHQAQQFPQPQPPQTQQFQLQPPPPPRIDSALARVPTARQADFESFTASARASPRPMTPPQKLQQPQTQPIPPSPMPVPSRNTCSEPEASKEITNEPPHTSRSSRAKHTSRPPSTHSTQSRQDSLRPHPLIRGMSHGTIHNIVPKPSPLAPLTVLPQEALPQVSTSPVSSLHDGNRHNLSSSPTSIKTSSGSPASVDHPTFPMNRRTSFSSSRSVHTIPVHSTFIKDSTWTHDRTRTVSSMSASSSAALSALAHLPTVTRPPSPQAISFFPPVNPHANVEGIHPLLPVPYLHNHLTVLSRRTPIRESFDRVMRAKTGR